MCAPQLAALWAGRRAARAFDLHEAAVARRRTTRIRACSLRAVVGRLGVSASCPTRGARPSGCLATTGRRPGNVLRAGFGPLPQLYYAWPAVAPDRAPSEWLRKCCGGAVQLFCCLREGRRGGGGGGRPGCALAARCVAPVGYAGMCGKRQSFAGMRGGCGAGARVCGRGGDAARCAQRGAGRKWNRCAVCVGRAWHRTVAVIAIGRSRAHTASVRAPARRAAPAALPPFLVWPVRL